MPKVLATAKNLRVSARKLGLVASLVRGRSAKDAAAILEHTPKAAAKDLAKVVKSAQANAENNSKLDADKLVVGEILVSNGGIIKRYRAGARGMVRPVRHRLAQVTVVLDEAKTEPIKKQSKPVAKPKPEVATAKAEAK
jgi:large subunit ribosomal protein L22